MRLKDARSAEEQGRIEQAAELYEQALLADPAQVDALIDLVVLYWHATDYGVWKAEGLDLAFVRRAGERFRELLVSGRAAFPGHPAMVFWQKYIAWAETDAPLRPEECRALLRAHPDYLEPALYLFATSHGSECRSEARRLLAACEHTATWRCRYIRSVIAPLLSRLDAARPPAGDPGSVATHEAPARRERADFLIFADLSAHGLPGRWEQLWARRLGETDFELCCIPYFIYGLALGDTVRTRPSGEKNYVIEGVSARSGRRVLRLWLKDASAGGRERLLRYLEARAPLHEWSSDNLLAIDVPAEGDDAELSALLAGAASSGIVVEWGT